MKKGLSVIALVFSLFLGNTSSFAQAGLNTAEKRYDRWAYMDAIKMYEKVFNRGFSNQQLVEKLGNAYYFNARYSEAQKYYQKLFSEYNSSDVSTEYLYRYAHTLQNVGDEKEAKKYYDAFVKKAGSEAQISKIRKNEESLQKQIKENSGRISNIANLAINTPYADYGSFVNNETFYYTSARDTGNFAKKRHTWTGDAFTNLYEANVNEVGEQDNVNLIKSVKTRLNESSAIITKDRQTMYFTRNNIVKGKRRYDANKNTKLKIFRAELIDGKWANITELPFNSDQFNTTHPTLSADERTLYFSSDRPNGFGEADLWKVTVNGDQYGTPENLGEGINTEGRETFPFVVNNELYFSSNGRVGLGGLDVFAANIKDNETFGEVQNIGTPINSEFDDFAYYIDGNTKNGFFSSNRDGGKGNDDIYSFTELRPLVLDCNQQLHVKVRDAKTGELISDAKVTLADGFYNVNGTSYIYVAPTYNFNHGYECGDIYHIKAEKEGYVTQEIKVTLPNESGITEAEIILEPAKIPLKPGDDLFKALNLNPIYFDLDKYYIRPDAALELAKVYAVLEEYPTMKIDIRSHTDSRQTHKYNETLSSNRAKSTAEWLISNGINRNRLTWKGYGETQLVNGCADGVDCSEAEHQMNRRSEFIIVEM
ncbi:OmpA family protein [Flavobacterium dauae]|uniref:OmpA family protein n=1 Tax=Flavobacterium dauae TaxID=1563479 RepID=UPI00101B3A46|nr:OmpA family protein [Flavobacterium dauae]WLD23598.1 OmpA family protein [Flavobacterium dauae]